MTFFTFNDEKESYDEDLLKKRRLIIENQKKKEIDKKENELNDLLILYRKLSKKEQEELELFNKNLKEVSDANYNIFSNYLLERKKGSLAHLKPTISFQYPSMKDIENHLTLIANNHKPADISENLQNLAIFKCDDWMISNSEKDDLYKLKVSFFENLLKTINKKHDLLYSLELKKHELYSPKIESLEKEIKQAKNYISKFENEERIESTDLKNLNEKIAKMNQKGWVVKQMEGIQSGKSGGIRDGGYGYSFTKGILILWERNNLV